VVNEFDTGDDTHHGPKEQDVSQVRELAIIIQIIPFTKYLYLNSLVPIATDLYNSLILAMSA